MPAWLDKLLKRKSLSELEDADLEAFFTDVEHLRDVFHRLVTAPSLPKRLLVIHGVGGVGKSILLRMYRLYCKRQGVPVSLVSGDEAKTPVDVLRGFAAHLAQDGINLAALQRTLERYRAIQAKVEREGAKIAGAAVKAGAKAAVEMAASAIPVVGPVVGAFGGAGAEAFVDWLRGFLPRSDVDLYLDPAAKLTQDFVKDLAPAAEKRRLVLMLDTYEQMAGLDGWVRDLIQQLSSNVLTVIAGRAMPAAAWDRAWPAWMAQAHVEELQAMSEEDMWTLVQRYYATMRGDEPDPTQVEEIVRFARGLPMVVTSAVRLWVRYGAHDFRAVKPQVVADLVDRLMEGTPPEMRPVLEAAAALRWFNKELLRELLPARQVEQVYDELRRFPFVRSRVEGLALHDVVREMLDENLKAHDPKRHRVLHEKAAAHFEARSAQAAGDEHDRWTLELLYHRIRADEKVGIRLFQEMAEELVRYRFAGRLRGLLKDVKTYPLEIENNRLWHDYYVARLIHLEGRQDDAKKVYHTIGENDQAEPNLQAYALCDWVDVQLTESKWTENPDTVQEVIRRANRSLEVAPSVDLKLLSNYNWLRAIYGHIQARWDKALEIIQREQTAVHQIGDKYSIALNESHFMDHYARVGNWKEAFRAQRRGLEIISSTSQASTVVTQLLAHPWWSGSKQPSTLEIQLLAELWWTWVWAGRYFEIERNLRQSISKLQKAGVVQVDWFYEGLGYTLGMQTKFDEATEYFAMAQNTAVRPDLSKGRLLGFWGSILARQRKLEHAKRYLLQSISLKTECRDIHGTQELFNWLAEVYELEADWEQSESYYRQTLNSIWLGRPNFESGALTGLVRVRHAHDQYAAIPPLLAEAEHLAQQYEYNDHLASLRLTQGHIAWDGHVPEWGIGFGAALVQYQQALIYALRYNRFLLDEVLWGGDVATPLRPIIPHCLERGDEGHQMLVALRDWWQTGVNDIGTPRPGTISLIPEGIPLLEAERIAREREPGDGSPQQTVIEKIEDALATAPDSQP